MKGSAAIVAALVLAACGEARTVRTDPEIPLFVQEMIDVDPPADGQVHVQSRGRFDFTPTTLFCGVDPIVDPALRPRGVRGTGLVGLVELMEKLGQPLSLNGSMRQRYLDPVHCPANAQNVVQQGFVLLNRDGEPYRLILAFWQGQAGWVGTVERAVKGPRPEVFNPYGTDPLRLEVAADTTAISRRFLAELSGEK